MREPGPGARILGAHLEGRSSARRRWARSRRSRSARPRAAGRAGGHGPDPGGHLCARDPAGELLAAFRRRGVRADRPYICDYAQARAALAAGAAGFPSLQCHVRPPASGSGAVGAALGLAASAELILDFEHVDEGAARTALRAVPRLHCVTDAVAAAMPDGEYRLGTHRIFKRGGTVRLADGLAGSVLTWTGHCAT